MNETQAEAALIAARWPGGAVCPRCGSRNVNYKAGGTPSHLRCRTCRGYFSVRTFTEMHSSNLPLLTWLRALYIFRSDSQITVDDLQDRLGVATSTAWHLRSRLRRFDMRLFKLPTPVCPRCRSRDLALDSSYAICLSCGHLVNDVDSLVTHKVR